MNRQERFRELPNFFEFSKRMIGQLSGGEQQRVSIVIGELFRSSMQTNTGSLDSATIIQLFTEWSRMTIIIVTHNHTSAKHCDRTVKIKMGESSRLVNLTKTEKRKER